MPALTRRRYPERTDCWHVYYGDVHVGTIVRSVGNPNAEPLWQWRCGFYPGSEPGEFISGTGATFAQAREGFEAAWRVFLPKRTEADFHAWRNQRDSTTLKYAAWERGEKLPSQKPNSMMCCPCGKRFDSHRPGETVVHVPHITAAHATDGRR